MKVDPLVALTNRAAGAAQLLLFQGDADFSARLTLGQIIKGRVLRSYEGQRYAVEFDGQRRTVDSSVPLSTGEIIHGRVIGLGEQVTLQRIKPAPATADVPAPDAALAAAGDAVGGAIAALFERYQAKLDGADFSTLQQLAARTAAPEQAALAGLVLNKLGLQITPEFLRAVYATLSKPETAAAFALSAQALVLGSIRAAVEQDPDALALWLGRAISDIPEARLRETRGDAFDADGGDGGENDLARWILNAQTGGAVAHRVATLPLLLDGELVELDVALFAQAGDGLRDGPRHGQPESADGSIRHRELVFALTTATLGRVEVRALLANGHLRLSIAADSSASTQWLAEHAGALEAGLQQVGWLVDEQRYESRVAGQGNGVIGRVVEHLISPGSVSRLV